MQRTIALGSAALCALLGGCAHGGTPANPATASEFDVRTAGRECAPESFPAYLPAFADLADTARLGPLIRGAVGSEEATGEVVLSLWYQADGLNVRRDVLAHNVTPSAADTVQKLVFTSLGTAPTQEREWGARLRVRTGPQSAFTLERREFCPPRPRSTGLEAEMAGFTGTGVRYRNRQRERVELVEVVVHPAGYVAEARLTRDALRGSQYERQVRDLVRQYSFFPASLDGIPVFGSIRVPVRLRG